MNPIYLTQHEYDHATAEARRLGYESFEKFMGNTDVHIIKNIAPAPKEKIILTGRAARRARDRGRSR